MSTKLCENEINVDTVMTIFAPLLVRPSVFSWADGTEVTSTLKSSIPNEIWITQEGYEIKLTDGLITSQTHGCTLQMQNYFGFM